LPPIVLGVMLATQLGPAQLKSDSVFASIALTVLVGVFFSLFTAAILGILAWRLRARAPLPWVVRVLIAAELLGLTWSVAYVTVEFETRRSRLGMTPRGRGF